jgi:DNA-binding transcriptional ArsR family regulator
VKQITEIDDARLVKGLAHPLRIQILRVLQDGVASPSEIAGRIQAPLGNVSYHVRFLARVGLIELASTKPRRGAVEHYYRAAGRVLVSDKAWAQVPQVVRNSLFSSTLGQVGRVIAEAAGAGGFDREDTHVSRTSLVLDERGFSEIAGELAALMERANVIESDSARRLAADSSNGTTVSADLVMMLFESARPGEAALAARAATDGADAAPDRKPARRARASKR